MIKTNKTKKWEKVRQGRSIKTINDWYIKTVILCLLKKAEMDVCDRAEGQSRDWQRQQTEGGGWWRIVKGSAMERGSQRLS